MELECGWESERLGERRCVAVFRRRRWRCRDEEEVFLGGLKIESEIKEERGGVGGRGRGGRRKGKGRWRFSGSFVDLNID